MGQPLLLTGYVLLGFATCKLLYRYYKMCTSPLRHLPGPPRANFWTGYFWDIFTEPFLAPHKRWFNNLQRPPIFQYTGLLGRYTVVVMDPNIVQQVLTDPSVFAKDKTQIRFPKRYKLLREITGEGLVTLEGPDWARHRRICQPCFQTNAISQALDARVPALTKQLIAAWHRAGPTRVIDLASHLSALTLDIIGHVAFAHDFGALQKLHQWVDASDATNNNDNDKDNDTTVLDHVTDPLIRYMHESFRISLTGVVVQVLDIPWAERYLKRSVWKRRVLLNAATDDIIREAQQNMDMAHRQSQHKSLLQLLLEARAHAPDSRNALSDVELRDECKTFILAGHETTSTWCYWALYALAVYPQVQDKLLANVGGPGASQTGDPQVSTTAAGEATDTLHLKDVLNMDYLGAFMEEVLRFYSPVGMLIRFSAREEEWHGYTIPRNTRIVLPFHMLQRHPDYWHTDPEIFAPERWLDKDTPPYSQSFVHNPFSAGGRNCIGQRFAQMEAKLIIANLVRAFQIRLAPGTENDKLEFTSAITVKAKIPLRICVEAR